MADQAKGANGSVFISYSRKDKPFVKKLNDALDSAGVHAWVDWEGIELASDWMQRISAAIQDTDALLFVVSPDSLKSKICMDELELALNLNKKLIPILLRLPEKRTKIHKQISATNWVYMRKEDNFRETLPKLVEAINTDLTWVQEHTKLLGQAAEWEKKKRNSSFLLNGAGLEEAERWMADASGKTNRQILPLQAEYITASRQGAIRRQRSLLIGVSLAAVVSLAAAAIAVFQFFEANQQRVRAEQNEATAKANELAAMLSEQEAREAQAFAEEQQRIVEQQSKVVEAQSSAARAQYYQSQSGELDTSTLLAIDSWQRNPSADAEDLIRSNASLLPVPIAQMSQDGAIWNIEWSPDYEYFVTGNSTYSAEAINQACVYRAGNGEVVYCVPHEDDVNDAIFAKDGKYLITASVDRTVKFWDALNGEPIERLNLTFEGAVLDLDVSNSVLAIAREDNYLTLYYLNLPDQKPLHHAQVDGVRSVKFSPNGAFLAFGLQNGNVRFWHARDYFFYEGPKHLKSSYVVLAFSPDSNWLVSGGGDSIARLTKRDGTFRHQTTHGDWVEGVAFGPDPSWYVTVSDDNIVRVLETETGIEKFRMAHTDFVQKVTVSSDGQWIASTGYDQVVRIWDSVSGSQILEIPLETNGSAISFNKDTTRLVVADENGNIGIWDISKLKARTGYIEFTEFVHEARFTPSGEDLIVNADDFNVWKIPSGQVNQIENGTAGNLVLTTESLTYNTAVSPDSQWLAVVEYDSEDAKKNRGTLISMDKKTKYPLEHGGEVNTVAFTPDSKLVATSGVDGLIWFWDVETGKKQFNLNNSESIYSMAISPTGQLAAGLTNKIRIWDINTQEQVAEIQQSGDNASLAFSQDGKWLATGSSEGTVILWSIEGNTFTQSGKAVNLNGFAQMLAFSPDGRWLAGAGSTSYAYLWDTSTMQEMARIVHGNPVTSVSFSLDGTQLLTVSRKAVRIWDISAISLIPKDQLISIACSHLVSNFSREEWTNLFGEEEYRLHCTNLP